VKTIAPVSIRMNFAGGTDEVLCSPESVSFSGPREGSGSKQGHGTENRDILPVARNRTVEREGHGKVMKAKGRNAKVREASAWGRERNKEKRRHQGAKKGKLGEKGGFRKPTEELTEPLRRCTKISGGRKERGENEESQGNSVKPNCKCSKAPWVGATDAFSECLRKGDKEGDNLLWRRSRR